MKIYLHKHKCCVTKNYNQEDISWKQKHEFYLGAHVFLMAGSGNNDKNINVATKIATIGRIFGANECMSTCSPGGWQ